MSSKGEALIKLSANPCPKAGPPLTCCRLSILATIIRVVIEVVYRLDQDAWLRELSIGTSLGAKTVYI
jgi:hypothetical protein